MEEQLHGFLKELLLRFLDDADEEQIHPGAQFAELGVASLDLVEVQVEFQKRYGIQVPSTLFAQGKLKTLDDLVQYAMSKLNAA